MISFNKIKIIFFLECAFNERDFKRYGVKLLTELGYVIEVWDFTPLLHPIKSLNYNPSDLLLHDNHKIIKNKIDTKKQLLSLKKTDLVLALIPFNSISNFIFNHLNDFKIHYGFSFVNTIPVSNEPLSNYKKLITVFNNPKTIISKLSNKLNSSYNQIKIPKANFLMIGGSASLDSAKSKGFFNDDLNLIYTHSRDYDLFLENKENIKKSPFDDYILMLDEFAPYHPDTLYSGNEPACKPETYYPYMNRFFNKIENQLNMQVIIASHPRANYDKIENPFDGRKIIRGETIELVKNAKLVLAHASTAINFAILYSKPLIFLNSSKFSHFYQHSINITSKTLSKKAIDISNDIQFDFSDFFNFNKKAYNHFQECFIKTSGSEDLNQWIIFSNFIQSGKLFK